VKTVFLAPSTFASLSKKPLKILKSQNHKIRFNKVGRKLNKIELLDNMKDVDGVIAGTESYSGEILSELTKLKVISRLGVGIDNIDMEVARGKNIKVFRTNTTPAPAVAELVLGLMIDVHRHISISNQLLKKSIWKKQMGSLLQGKTLGIIGLGTIGKELVHLSKGFRFKVLSFDHQEDELFAKKNDVTYCGLETLLKGSDIVSIHLNLTDQTKTLIDQEKIAFMKPGAIIINTSRGEIIDEKALYAAIKNNQLGGAGLDVFEHEPYTGPITGLDNVVLTPHIGAYAKEIRVSLEMEAVENLIRGLNEA